MRMESSKERVDLDTLGEHWEKGHGARTGVLGTEHACIEDVGEHQSIGMNGYMFT